MRRQTSAFQPVSEVSRQLDDTAYDNVKIVKDNIDDIVTVSEHIDDITTANTNISNIDTVANSIDDVNIVSTNMPDLNAVADALGTGACVAVTTNIGDIVTVADNIASVNTTATNIANVNTVSTNIINVDTTATNIANINSVAATVVPNIVEILLADDNAVTATTQAGIATTKANEASADADQTALDRIATTADKVATNADVVLTHADVLLTHTDATQTALDKIATNADAAQTALDVIETNADVLLTHADVVLTHADANQTAADRVQTGLDATTSGQNATNAATAYTNTQLASWIAEANRMTAESYAIEPEDVFVKVYTSDGDGTFTSTNTTDYSAYHWEQKAYNIVGTVNADMVSNTPAGNIQATDVQAAINELDSEKQPLDATLTALAGVTTSPDIMIYATGIDTFTTTTLTSFGRSLLDDTSASDARTTIEAEYTGNKGIANGYASLDAAGIVPSTQLPSYVDDVLEYADLLSFPTTGETGKIYVALDTNKTYRWSGSTYILITSGAVDSVAGKTGVVTLVKADVGLGSVDNTSDIDKPVSSATQTALNNKVDKITGKQLSTEDYTTEDKTKVSILGTIAVLSVAPTVPLASVNAETLIISAGTGPITSFGPGTEGEIKRVFFMTTTTITQNINYILIGNTLPINFQVGIMDTAEFICASSSTWICISYHRGTGKADLIEWNNISNKPIIPDSTSDLVNDSGFIDNTYHDSTKQNTSEKGQANGYASLDVSGKVPIAQIPSSVVGNLSYQGVWNANTNTPTLVNGTGTQGYYYKVSVAGSTTIDGNTNWTIGDLIVFNGTAWDKIEGGSSDVVSVAGKAGAVTLVKGDVGLGSVDNTADSTKNVLSATKLTTTRTISLDGDVTGSVSFDGTGDVSITSTVVDDSHNHIIANVDGLQTAIDGKQSTITGAATTITDSNLTVSRAVVSDTSGKVGVSTVTSTELGYVSGVTSAIQTQLGTKAPLASPALTGTPTAPTATAGDNTTKVATTAYVLANSINNLVEDTTPQLGGNLDLNGKAIPLTLNAKTGTTYTAVLTDSEKIITLSNASPITMTIPSNASVAYPIGTKLNFMQLGAGQVTISITTDTLNVNAALTKKLNGQYAVATAVKVASTSWVLFGNLELA